MASSFTSFENLSAPDAKEASASPAVFAAAVPKAAASFRLEANAAIAICSPAFFASTDQQPASVFRGCDQSGPTDRDCGIGLQPKTGGSFRHCGSEDCGTRTRFFGVRS